MQPQGRIWQELTWSWAYSTGHPTSDQRLEAAAKAVWPYALFCAWTYLNDHAAAHDLLDHAVQNAFDLGPISFQRRVSKIKLRTTTTCKSGSESSDAVQLSR
jgi:hypothetical protein